ncbi:MAG: tetratricopeptide repeat protein, partial [Bdellovibrio sp.]|nr:tetratricopeptide repeat protein [Bdellovibrio sp.]
TILFHVNVYAEKLDSRVFITQEINTESDENVKSDHKNSKMDILKHFSGKNEKSAKQQNVEELIKVVDSYTVIINRTKPGVLRNQYVQMRVKAEITLGQVLILENKKSKKGDIERYLTEAKKDALGLLSGDPQFKSKSYYLAGLSSVYLDQYDEASRYFSKALEIDSHSPFAPWMGFFLAEEYFEKDRYKESISLYKKYLNDAEPALRQIGLYKIAWAYASLGDTNTAKDLFLEVTHNQPGSDLAKDAVRDLAFIVTKNKIEKEIIDFADENFGEAQMTYEFLRQVYFQRKLEGLLVPNSMVLKRLLDLEQDIGEKIKYLTQAIHSLRRAYASQETYNLFLQIISLLDENKITAKTDKFNDIKADLELAMQNLMKSFIDTFSGRVKAPENISKANLGDNLKDMFSFFIVYFPKSPLKKTVYQLWLEVCMDLEDYESTILVADKALEESSMPPEFRTELLLEKIAAYEKLYAKDNFTYFKSFVANLELFHKNYIEHKFWMKISKRLASIYLDNKHYSLALPVFEKIYSKEPTFEVLYPILFSVFSLKQYIKVLSDNRIKDLRNIRDEKILALYRESALKQAELEKEKRNTQAYSKWIQIFLTFQNDPAKIKIVKLDKLSYYHETKAWDLVSQELLTTAPNERYFGDYKFYVQNYCVHGLKQGDFKSVYELISQIKNFRKELPALLVDYGGYYLLSELSYRRSVNLEILSQIPQENREYILSLLSFYDPKKVLEYFHMKQPKNTSENTIALLALRMDKNMWDFTPSSGEGILVAQALPLSMKVYPKTVYEKRIENIVFPNAHKGSGQYEKVLQVLVEQTRSLRQVLGDELKDKTLEVKYRVISASQKLEQNTALAIQNAPLPRGLATEQIPKYKDELLQVSKEFLDQAEEVKKLNTQVYQAIQNEKQKENLRTINEPDLERWPWPFKKLHAETSVIYLLIKNKQFLQALILTDFLKKEHIENDNDYYLIRTGILLSSVKTSVMRRYLYEELIAYEKESVIETWKGLANKQ